MYDFMSEILGRTLTSKEHEDFKEIIRAYFDSTDKFVRYREALNSKPVEHILTCGNCKRIERASGYKDRKKTRRTFICP